MTATDIISARKAFNLNSVNWAHMSWGLYWATMKAAGLEEVLSITNVAFEDSCVRLGSLDHPFAHFIPVNLQGQGKGKSNVSTQTTSKKAD